MGYTHYWTISNAIPLDTFELIASDAAALADIAFARNDVRIAWESDQPDRPAEFGRDLLIRFNGIGEDGHETFYFEPHPTPFQFCKTARKPYDVLVAAILAIAEHHAPGCINVRSDGDREEWTAAMELVRLHNSSVDFPQAIQAAEVA